jgi:tetratricopeptide (TPR) repeat protein
VSRPFPFSQPAASVLGFVLAAGGLGLPAAIPAAALAQASEPERTMATAGSPFDITAVQALLARGDAAAAAGNLAEARRLYDQARDASRKLLSFYRDLSGAFRGLDARIPREMDEKGRQTLDLLVGANMRLAALFRRQGQPEVAVPLLVEVVKTMTPANESGRKAYQQLLEIGFVSTPYTAPGGNP